MSDHERYMAMALEEAEAGAAGGEQPFGALVRCGDAVISRAHSRKVSESDATAHSEIRAISAATRARNERTLPACTFYATCEPCPMCAGAILNAGIDTVVVGARIADLVEADNRQVGFHDYTLEAFARLTAWKVTIIDGVLGERCVELYRRTTVPLTR